MIVSLQTIRCVNSSLMEAEMQHRKSGPSSGLFTFTDADSDPNSNPIPVLGSWDGNLKLTPCSVNRSAYYNVTIWFEVQIQQE